MAFSTDFEGSNLSLLAPEGQPDVNTLRAYRDDKQTVSCWKLTAEERKMVEETGLIWLSVWGASHPPVMVSGVPLIAITQLDGTQRAARPIGVRGPFASKPDE